MLTPETWGKQYPDRPSLHREIIGSNDEQLPLVEVMLRLVKWSIEELCHKNLATLLNFFEKLVSGKSALLDPDYHDSLLSDNESFSRSKAYFWAINTLKEIDESISENITQLERCADYWPFTSSWPPRDESHHSIQKQTTHIHLQLKPSVEKLSSFREKFKALREEAKALRDGVSVSKPPLLKTKYIEESRIS
jgi:hypothetical protein